MNDWINAAPKVSSRSGAAPVGALEGVRAEDTASQAIEPDVAQPDRPLTRRELRALGLAGFSAPAPAVAPTPTEPPAEVAVIEAPAAPVVEDSPVADQPSVETPVIEVVERRRFRDRIRAPFVETPPGTQSAEPALDAASLSKESERSDDIAAPPAFEDLVFPGGDSVETTVEPETADIIPTTFDAFAAPLPETRVPDGAESYTPPIGHWSTQASIDDDEQAQEATSARNVAATSGAITTNALVLPSIPTAEDIMRPFSGTGEILITGSINLPSSMGTTGVHPTRYDHSDVDTLLEADDREDSDPDSAPVRAIRAISTNTGSGDVINSMKPQKASRLPMILTIVAAAMAVAVVVLLVAGAVFGIFK